MGRTTDDLCSLPVTLASASPRRRELLALLGISFVIAPNSGEEQDDPPPPIVVAAMPPCPLPLLQHPTLLAWRKVNVACTTIRTGVIIGADTSVVIDGEVLGKPRDDAHARAMLAQLSGRTHIVYTGICTQSVALAGDRQASEPLGSTLQYALVGSEVTIAALSETEIAAYVATGEPQDKAGAYGIQGLGGRLVQQVHGSYTNVVGLPLLTTWEMLRAAGLTDLIDPVAAYHSWIRSQGKEPLPCPPTSP